MRAALFALLLCAAGASPLAAHTRLERSVPAAGDTVRYAAGELRLVFSQAVVPRYTRLLLRAPDGTVLLDGMPSPDSGGAEYALLMPRLPQPGTYTVEWRATASDGHVISGSFAFLFAPDSAALAQAAAVPPKDTARLQEHHADPALLPGWLRPDSWANVVARTLQFAALLALLGLAAFRVAVLPRFVAPAEIRDALRTSLRRFGTAALVLLLLTLPLRLWLQSAALHGPELALERGLLGSLLLELDWGRVWLLQLGAAALLTVAVLAGVTALLVLGALALALAPAFQGHAAAVEGLRPLALASDIIHVIAAGTWVGTLGVLLLAAIPVLWYRGAPHRAVLIHALVHRFSPVALTAAAVLALTGAVSALFHLSAPADLLVTVWGRMLLLKLAFVGLIGAAGFYNWRRATPRLDAEGAVVTLYGGATLELLFAGAALAATGALVGLPTP